MSPFETLLTAAHRLATDAIDTVATDAHWQSYLIGSAIAIALLFGLRLFDQARIHALKGSHKLSMVHLNSTRAAKEVFLAYLGGAVCEPVLTIGGSDDLCPFKLALNLLTLASILSWIFLISDAFDFSDVAQQKVYRGFQEEASQDRSRYRWLSFRNRGQIREDISAQMAGSLSRDFCLWSLFLSIGAAWSPVPISHRDVIHSYVILCFWAWMHHSLFRAGTAWGANYFTSFLLPSSVLSPLEYTLAIADVIDCVESLEDVEAWRSFIAARTGGVWLDIES